MTVCTTKSLTGFVSSAPIHYMMIAVGYARVSTNSQLEEGISLEAQEPRIQGGGQAKGSHLQQAFIEARSAARADTRPQLQVALGRACQSKAALVVFSLSRL